MSAVPVTLVCIPHAGGVSSEYRPWRDHLPPGWFLEAVSLPGREQRFREPLLHSVEAMAADVQGVLRRAPRERPVIIFGHSLGALIALEAAWGWEQAGGSPALVVTAAHRAPHLPGRDAEIATLSRDALVKELTKLGGMPAEIIAEPDLLELVLPRVRADLGAAERYRWSPDRRLRAALLALGGRVDDGVPAHAVAAWGRQTTGRFTSSMLEGGHFFVHRRTEEVLATMEVALRDALGMPQDGTAP